MGCKLFQTVLLLLFCEHGIEKKFTLRKCKSKKTMFHSFLLKNQSNKFQYKLELSSQKTIYRTYTCFN
jgi:hypothetical protein